jgi:hypothetical protein
VEEPLTSTGQRLECRPDALPYHSADRGIPLFQSMGLLGQRMNLAAFRQLRAQKGTHWGEINHARGYFADAVAAGNSYPTIAIVFQTDEPTPSAVWYQVDPSGGRTLLCASPSNFNYDGASTKRTRWWAFIDFAGTGYAAPNTYDSGGVYDTSGWVYDAPSLQAQQDLAAMFSTWHSSHSWLGGVVGIWPAASGAPFPTSSGTPTQNSAGWWSLPNGAGTWASIVGADGRGSRPPNFVWFLDNPAP